MSNARIVRALVRCSTALALAVLLLSAQPAAAQQFWIAPNHSVVVVGKQQPIPVGGTFVFGPAVIHGNKQFVRIGGPFSGTIVTPGGFGTAGFIKPQTATDRVKASAIYGGMGPQGPIVVNPFQVWWK